MGKADGKSLGVNKINHLIFNVFISRYAMLAKMIKDFFVTSDSNLNDAGCVNRVVNSNFQTG
ncbi:hypothetical protein [Klebsiella pneumoniae]|uniref:hypothetical protein n=1 Tax=Klebsiella pneumoniae TaxID=573 RepID=UPI001E40F347|nr:hypothetical protein [Klebsiella pneumoniae]MCD5750990.1 hypothetical protein [Klebsiella pneumoniae]UGM74540.1 hypothetical protein K9F37_19310 [Klebsiella pneumoniae]